MEPNFRPDPAEVAKILDALADPVRMEMVRRLRSADTDQGCAALYDDLPKSTASYHFSVLRNSGLIEQYDAGGRRFNRLRLDAIGRVTPGLLEAIYGT